MQFTTHTMQEIIPQLQAALRDTTSITFEVLDPDHVTGLYAGEEVEAGGICYLYRSLRVWMELAEQLGCRMRIPQKSHTPLVRITYEKRVRDSFHTNTTGVKAEKYGSDSLFARIHKMEEAAFLHYYLQALHNVNIDIRRQILDLGINRGDEFEVIRHMVEKHHYQQMQLVGIDHAQSAILDAKLRFPEPNVSLYAHDINDLASLNLPKADLLISIGTLQSPGINYKPFLMDLVQNHLTQNAALILGFPNSRWIDGEMVYGAKAPNYAMSEMSLLFNDVMFAKKYLQQKKFRVTITGKQYIFLTATKITSSINQK